MQLAPHLAVRPYCRPASLTLERPSARSSCPLPAVQACKPQVPGLQPLLAQLNGGGSFSAFVRCMRREFQALVQAEMQQQQQQGQAGGAAAAPVAAC